MGTTTGNMKLNVSYPANGSQKLFEIEDERKLNVFMEKRMGAEVPGDSVGDEFKGYIFKITGGNDKQGFPMKQGVLVPGRVRLLLSKGRSCFRERRDGERRRKSVRGCIVSSDLSVLSLVIVKKGAADVPGLTDTIVPRRLGPKRANNIRKLFNLSKQDDVRKFVVQRKVTSANGKTHIRSPRIQRLITPARLQRKRRKLRAMRAQKEKSRQEAADYHKLLKQRMNEQKARREASISKRRSASVKKAS